MKILYLHGLRERNSKILKFLKTTSNTIISPDLDPWKPAETFKRVSEISADYIIGFSLGGFFASRIKTESPILLINPALCFPDILKSRHSPNPELTEGYSELLPYLGSNITAIFTTEDYKIGLPSLPIYQELWPESDIMYLPGGHNPGEEIKKEITKFLNNMMENTEEI